MSGIVPIASFGVSVRCPLYPQKRTCAVQHL